MHLSSPHNPQCIFRPLSAHNSARSSFARSPQSRNTPPAPTIPLNPRSLAPTIGCYGCRFSSRRFASWGWHPGSDNYPRIATGRLPHQASLCLKLRPLCSPGSSSTISSSAINSRSANSAAAAAVDSACVRE